jgi:uncharacterized DUF497 family protein
MPIEFDPAKNRRNIELRGLPLDLAADLDWETAIVGIDDRRDYGERRFWALGMIGSELFNVVFTLRGGRMRVISLRRASRKERSAYAAKA